MTNLVPVAREKDAKIFTFLDGKGVYKGVIKWNIGGRRDLGRKVGILEMWSVRFQGYLSDVGIFTWIPK